MILAAENSDKIEWVEVHLAINEFTSHEDYVGLFPGEPESETFFSVEKSQPSVLNFPLKQGGMIQPKGVFEVFLSNQKYENERKVYTLMTLIGDIGGFQGAIIILPTFLLSFYAPKMFEAQLLSEMPVKKTKQRQKV